MFTSTVPAFIRRRVSAPAQPTVETRQLSQKNIYQKLALYCGEPFRKIVMRVTTTPIYATPSIPLEAFINHILLQSNAPLPALHWGIAITRWVIQDNNSPLASASRHHLFFACYQYSVQKIWGLHKDDEEWVTMVAGYLPKNEIMAMKSDMAGVVRRRRRGKKEWEVVFSASKCRS